MRIITLNAENVKRLKAVEIKPDGDVVVIAGRNAQGKSSILDAIQLALAGGFGAKETTRPIRDGETKASVVLDLGDLVVTRRWTESGTTLELAAKDGARYGSPQTILDGLIGRLSFDPLAFAQQAPKEQLATLLSVVELPFDPEHLAAQRKGFYDDRTEANRDVKQIEAQLAGIPAHIEGTPEEEVSAAVLAATLDVALQQDRRRVEAMHSVEEARMTIARLEQELGDARDRERQLVEAWKACPEPEDPDPIRAKLAAVDATNAAVRADHERARLTAALTAARAASEALTAKIEGIDAAKAKAISEARMPLDGLSFDDDGVLYQGVPFAQASAAERLRVGIAVAMALNPKIRVIRITDGSLLDSENLKLIEEMAGEHDYQVWLERVDESGKVGIVIEDGQVVAQPKVKAAA